MITRRDWIAGSLSAAFASRLLGKLRMDSGRVSAISDEVADTPEGAIAFAKQYRLRWLELRNVPGQKTNYFFMDPADLRAQARIFADSGIGISFLNTNLLKFALPEAGGAREQAAFDRRQNDLLKCIGSAQILHCDKIRIFTFKRTPDPNAVLPRIAEIISPLVKIAENEGIRLLVENEPSCNVGKCSESAALLNMVPSKAFGTNWDAMNGASLGEKPYPDGYAHLPKDRIWNVQIKGKTILDTPDHLDWGRILEALDSDGYSGEVGLETHFSHDEMNIEKSHESMREILRIVETSR